MGTRQMKNTRMRRLRSRRFQCGLTVPLLRLVLVTLAQFAPSRATCARKVRRSIVESVDPQRTSAHLPKSVVSTNSADACTGTCL